MAGPLGILSFERAQHKGPSRPSEEKIRIKAVPKPCFLLNHSKAPEGSSPPV